ncbi:hypothetical protein Q7P37_005864 [Cladosporium fusiforme]
MSCSKDTAAATKPRFLDLPAELRNRVYEHVLALTAKVPLQVALRDRRHYTRKYQLGLLRVNKQIYQEAAGTAYHGAVANLSSVSRMSTHVSEVVQSIIRRDDAMDVDYESDAQRPFQAGDTLKLIKNLTVDFTTLMLLAGACKKCDLARAFLLTEVRNEDSIRYLAAHLTSVTHVEVKDMFWSHLFFTVDADRPWLAGMLNHKGDVERLLAAFPLLQQIKVTSTVIGGEQVLRKEQLLVFAAGAKGCPRPAIFF